MALLLKATPEIVREYWRLFVNRRAYTVQSMRPHPESGRHYYFRPNDRQTGEPQMLTEETIRQHLEGDAHGGAVCHQSRDAEVQMGGHRRRLQERDGGPAETAVPPRAGQGRAGAGDEQARRPSLDLPGNAAAGQGMPDLHPRSGGAIGSAGKGLGLGGWNRGLSQT